jgi:hypothetical protein
MNSVLDKLLSDEIGVNANNFAFGRGASKYPPLKEGPLTKNGPIDFAQSWAIHMKKSN